jgi:hypothetical protein
MSIRFRKALLLSVVAAVLCAVVYFAVTLVRDQGSVPLAEAARRIGVKPTYADIVQYVNSTIHKGMSRDEVESTLRRVAPIEVRRGELLDTPALGGSTTCDYIALKIGSFFNYPYFSACYYGLGDSLFNWEHKSS